MGIPRWALAALFTIVAVPAAAAECIKAETPATLSGYIGTITLPGPPGYTDTADSDDPESIAFLFLRELTCIEDAWVEIVQLACDADPVDGGGVLVTRTGTIFEPETGHHHAQFLLACER